MALSKNLSRLSGYRPAASDPDDPALVLAMPLVLRIEKTQVPDRQSLLTAAARATVLACLDPRADTGGEWASAFDVWCDGRIRKIARRARGAAWQTAQEVPGVTVDVGGAQARAFVPAPVGAVDRRIAKLQIEGTDVPGDLERQPPEGGMCLWVAPDLPMTVGKLAAQVSHASMLGAGLLTVQEVAGWYDAGCPLVIRQADPARWHDLLAAEAAGTAVAVRDAGYTEVAPGSCTVIAAVCR
ncbi:MAG: peptidyl-tRNA hydrolase [Gordonia sp. (in: high G+C Gram-positive bacteria)]|uniref:peptidyl-tRNA hydrolase n=1 Tax=Gordonia sp. (in: high G+C Gram-positive bacteria) TaxID=84139 RepID=UPI0039E6E22B